MQLVCARTGATLSLRTLVHLQQGSTYEGLHSKSLARTHQQHLQCSQPKTARSTRFAMSLATRRTSCSGCCADPMPLLVVGVLVGCCNCCSKAAAVLSRPVRCNAGNTIP